MAGGALWAVLTVSLVSYFYINKFVDNNMSKQLDLASNVEQTLIDQHLAKVRDLAALVAGAPSVRQGVVGIGGTGVPLSQQLREWKAASPDLTVLTVVDPTGKVLARANSSATGQTLGINGLVAEAARRAAPVASPEVIGEAEWSSEGDLVKQQVVMAVKPTQGAETRSEKEVSGALSLVGVAPVRDAGGKVVALVVAAEVLNQNYGIVDEVRSRTNGLVTATIAMDGVRVTTNVKLKDASGKPTEARAIGTIYSIPVMTSLRQGKEYRGRAQVAGEWQRTVYTPLKDHTGQVIAGPYVGIPETTFFALRRQSLLTLLLVALGIVAVSFVAAMVAGNVLASPAKRLKEATDRVAGGDLSIDDLRAESNDEYGDMALSFNRMAATLRELLRQAADTSSLVTESAGQLTQNTEQMATALHGVAQAMVQTARDATLQTEAVQDANQTMSQLRLSIAQISSGAMEQAKSAQETVNTVTHMVASISGVAGKASTVSATTQQAAGTAEKGGQVVGKAIEGIDRARDSVLGAAQRIKDLGELSGQIGEIIKVITGIANQTNLLALNAAIEAARAGEHGRGFAVVADEVRKLAERARKGADDVGALIHRIQEGTDLAVQATAQGTEEVEAGARLAEDAGRALQEILVMVQRTTEDVGSIAAGAEQLALSSREVSGAVESVAAVSEQYMAATRQMETGAEQVRKSVGDIVAISEGNAAAAEEVSASVEEMNASVDEISSSAARLAQAARDLQAQIKRFKV